LATEITSKQNLARSSDFQAAHPQEQAIEWLSALSHSAIDLEANTTPAILTLDRNGRVISMSDAAVALTGFAVHECAGRGLDIFCSETEGKNGTAVGLLRRASQTGTTNCELNIIHRNGSLIPVTCWLSTLQEQNGDASNVRYIAILTSMRDEQWQRRNEKLDNRSEENTKRIIFALVADGIITTDFEGNISYMNPAAERMTGWSSGEAVGRPESEVFCAKEASREEFGADQSSAKPEIGQHLLRSRNGIQHDVILTVTPILDATSTIIGTVSVFRDITANRHTQAALKRYEASDALTGLPNRYEFERRLGGLLESQQPSECHVIFYIDLDQFKVINETCGHRAGDELLRSLAQILVTKVRNSDTVARLGGDEFAIVLEGCSVADAQRIAHQILWAIENFVFEWEEKKFKLTASVGIASLTLGQDVASALSIADRACQFAKDQGRNRAYVYQENDRDLGKRLRQMGWIPRLQDALIQNRFRLYLQPIVPLAQTSAALEAHYEVLLRLVDEQNRLVLPGAFIPAAERYHQMAAIDRWVVQAALTMARTFPQEKCVFAINLSGQTVGRDDFLPFVLDELDRSGIDPARFCFEITESAAIDNLDRAIRLISVLRQRGCRFALDDFGVGITSLSYLKRLEVDILKIDGSFIRGMTKSATDLALVRAIQQVAQSLGLQTVAECIEDQETMDILKDLAVDFAQGYFIGMPQAAETYADNAVKIALS
jgi:diguanylate cyclase (GGDEF)-like protein/PAS domain S-box-containing protein